MQVQLEPITATNVKAVFDLELAPHQRQYVAPDPWSLAQALAEHDIAWPRALARARRGAFSWRHRALHELGPR